MLFAVTLSVRSKFLLYIALQIVSNRSKVVLTTFYRSYTIKTPEHLPLANQEAWKKEIRSKINSAALHTNAILDDIIREKLVGFAGPMTLVHSQWFPSIASLEPIAISRYRF
jgi:hypothetical protein